ncbi:hypothetical protein, partial [Streptomyces sp. NPDC050804]|uniref:hypothetical protein n=1 Tax=Streptomyces sp. NPDC050804 TaxID=3154745 RepID=UPI003442E77F
MSHARYSASLRSTSTVALTPPSPAAPASAVPAPATMFNAVLEHHVLLAQDAVTLDAANLPDYAR